MFRKISVVFHCLCCKQDKKRKENFVVATAGRVEYYYCEVDTWHTTHANGIEVFYFPNGQTEAHHPSGTKEIIFPDGVIRRVFTDGREQDVTPEQLSGPVKYPMPEDRD